MAPSERGYNKKGGLVFLLKMHKLERLLIVAGSMFNRQHGDPNNSKLLQ